MLAAVTLVVGLFGSPRPALSAPVVAPCPAGPVESFVTSLPACPAVEISGRIDRTGATLDPAFDVKVAPSDLARPVENGSLLAGFTSDGRRVFALPISANGPFHIYVPLAPAAQQALARISLATAQGNAERAASTAAEPAAEIISVDDRRVIVAWNAAAYPAIRISETPDGRSVADGAGSSTYEQMSVDTRSRYVFVTFSDGVRSITRGFAIFGR